MLGLESNTARIGWLSLLEIVFRQYCSIVSGHSLRAGNTTCEAAHRRLSGVCSRRAVVGGYLGLERRALAAWWHMRPAPLRQSRRKGCDHAAKLRL